MFNQVNQLHGISFLFGSFRVFLRQSLKLIEIKVQDQNQRSLLQLIQDPQEHQHSIIIQAKAIELHKQYFQEKPTQLKTYISVYHKASSAYPLRSIYCTANQMTTRQQATYQSYSSLNRSLTPTQSSLNSLLKAIKSQLLENNIAQSENQLQNILSSSQKNQYDDSFYVSNLSNIINHLIAVIIEERQHNEGFMQQTSQNVEDNDKKILQGLQVFLDLTQRMANFSRDIFRERPEEKSLPVEICKHFRQVYELTEELSNIFNDYSMENQQFLSRKDELIALHIRCMEGVLIEEQNESQCQSQIQHTQSLARASRNGTSQQTEEYILSLRQQISHLHQTLLKNDEEFTLEIQNYNKTLRQMSSTIKGYELQFAKITNYELRIEQLQKVIVRMRQQKYRNEIVIENMARKIRNYEKELRGDKAFLSPQRQRLVSSPQSKFSMLNSKITSTLSMMNSINNSTGNLQSPVKKTLF